MTDWNYHRENMETFKQYWEEEVAKHPAFALCYRLQTVNFPASLNIIGSKAFSFCPLLEDLYFNSYTPEKINIANDAFDEHIFNTAIVYVPEGCVDAYRASSSFSKFKHICSIA